MNDPLPVAIPVTNQSAFVMVFNNNLNYVEVGDQLLIEKRSAPAGSFKGAVMDISPDKSVLTLRIDMVGVVNPGAMDNQWKVTNLSSIGLSFCNLTVGSTNPLDPNSASHTNTNPPLIRVAAGNFALWTANERWQCLWNGENGKTNLQGGGFDGVRSNGNQASLSEIDASAEFPSQGIHGVGAGTAVGEFRVRVLACKWDAAKPTDTSWHGTERCTQYPSNNWKPTGLLQKYGDKEQIHFGLMTGSYTKNISGGVLRKNIGALSDTQPNGEIHASTNGTFTAVGGIIKTLSAMRPYGYSYVDGSTSRWTTARTSSLPSSPARRLRDNLGRHRRQLHELGQPDVGNLLRGDPLLCRRRQSRQRASAADAGLRLCGRRHERRRAWPAHRDLGRSAFAGQVLRAAQRARVQCERIDERRRQNDPYDLRSQLPRHQRGASTMRGADERRRRRRRHYRQELFRRQGARQHAPGRPGFELCTGKTVTALGDVSGICPEGPTVAGSYLIAGIAQHARSNPIRTDIGIPANDAKSLKVTSYGIQLATNTPKLELDVPGKPGQKVVIQPIYRLDRSAGGGLGGGALVDMKYVRPPTIVGGINSGKVYLNWEDSEQGGDYDQDMWGSLEWSMDGTTIKVTTNAISASTANPQGFGYAISGTGATDGPHFYSGIYGFNFPDPQGVVALNRRTCRVANCQKSSDPAASAGPRRPLSRWAAQPRALCRIRSGISRNTAGSTRTVNGMRTATARPITTSS